MLAANNNFVANRSHEHRRLKQEINAIKFMGRSNGYDTSG